MNRLLRVCTLLFALVGFSLSQARAVTITYESGKGEGIWVYSYRVSDYTFNADYGLKIFFDYGLYKGIIPLSNGADWDVLTIEPELILGSKDPGEYNALALVDSASLKDPFTVQFDWLGAGSPGSQSFDIYDPSWATIQSGVTTPAPGTNTPAVPIGQPVTTFFLICGLLCLLTVKVKKVKVKKKV